MRLTWAGHEWTTTVELPSWKGFQSRGGAYGARDREEPSDGRVTLVYPGEESEPLTAADLANLRWFLDHQDTVSQAALRALAEAYPKLRAEYGFDDDDDPEAQEYMPRVDDPEGLRALVGLHTVHLHRTTRDGIPYVGFELGCTWDDEHGVGILVHGERVVDLGGADTAFLWWIADRDARGE